MLPFPSPTSSRHGRGYGGAPARQHDLLGPFYLPLHALAQAVSALVSVVLPGQVPSAAHAGNPLEQTFICLGT